MTLRRAAPRSFDRRQFRTSTRFVFSRRASRLRPECHPLLESVLRRYARGLAPQLDLTQILRMFKGGVFDAALGRVNGDASRGPASEEAGARTEVDGTPRVQLLGTPLAVGHRLRPDEGLDASVRSMPSHVTRKVEFLNARESTSAIYWVDFRGLEVHYVDLPPGMTTVLSSFANHVWVARDMASHAAISMYVVAPVVSDDSAVQHLIVTDVDFSTRLSGGDEGEDEGEGEDVAVGDVASASPDVTPAAAGAMSAATAADADAASGGGAVGSMGASAGGMKGKGDAAVEAAVAAAGAIGGAPLVEALGGDETWVGAATAAEPTARGEDDEREQDELSASTDDNVDERLVDDEEEEGGS